ncbi:MAG TPA: PQQ-dependent sugar dehydrogenase [Kofleriaceae bacterium]|jgi:glucose/arabinose dehydrogenase|nr:PQQ-dependent sugar dehydrogenase [Kofleriaceae bacterium]
MKRLAIAVGLIAACSSKNNNKPPGGGSDGGTSDGGSACTNSGPAVPITSCTPTMGANVSEELVATLPGNASALLVTSPPDDGRLFVVGQAGQIWVVQDGQVGSDPFLDITSDTMLAAEAPPGERGLLGLAFHPDYNCNGYFYVSYTTANADVVERFSVSQTDPNQADPMSGQIILSVPDPAENHNGSMLNFGSDGYLYISEGDGGNQEDPPKNGQALLLTSPNCNGCYPLLAKILRIDVDHPAGSNAYGIPPNNPYADGVMGFPEILIRGLRNPWRWTFDRATGDMYIGDVGQDTYEEVDVIQAANIDGAPNQAVNLGWSMYEGSACYQDGNGNGSCDPTNKTFPELIKTHAGDNWHAVIGGSVYRGSCYPQIQGNYYVTDNSFGGMLQTAYNPMMPAGSRLMTEVEVGSNWAVSPSSLNSVSSGEMYETDTTGNIWHLIAGP